MRIIFVGMHNKPNTMPLCGNTRSGKLINKIIDKLDGSGYCWVKSNLYDIDYYPAHEEKHLLALDWIDRLLPQPNDIIVLLGSEVHNYFLYDKVISHIVKLPHPSSPRSHEQMNNYVDNAVNKLRQFLEVDGKVIKLPLKSPFFKVKTIKNKNFSFSYFNRKQMDTIKRFFTRKRIQRIAKSMEFRK